MAIPFVLSWDINDTPLAFLLVPSQGPLPLVAAGGVLRVTIRRA
jgi:hypothetical protein